MRAKKPFTYLVYADRPPYGYTRGNACVVRAYKMGRNETREHAYDRLSASIANLRTVRAYSAATTIEASGVRCPNGRLKQRLDGVRGSKRKRRSR